MILIWLSVCESCKVDLPGFCSSEKVWDRNYCIYNVLASSMIPKFCYMVLIRNKFSKVFSLVSQIKMIKMIQGGLNQTELVSHIEP